MVSIIRRMKTLRQLLKVRTGPGAAILPKDVKRIHMEVATKWNDGQLGPRKFWRNYLPQLKYHNPGIPMTVRRTTDQSGPATMTIFFANPSSISDSTPAAPRSTTTTSSTSTATTATTSPNYAPTERIESFNMKHLKDSEIFSQLSLLTKLKPLKPTLEDEAMLQEIEEERLASERDAKRSLAERERRKREADMLKQAKGEMQAEAS